MRSRKVIIPGSMAAISYSRLRCSTISRVITPFGNGSRWRPWRGKGSSPPTGTPISGIPWTRSAIRITWSISGKPRQPPGGSGEGLLEGQAGLVTGHTGFKGSWLSLWLQRLGAEIVGYALQPPSQPNLFEMARVAEGMSSFTGDIRDLSHLTAAMRGSGPRSCPHGCPSPGAALIPATGRDVFHQHHGTVNVLEAVRPMALS